MEDFQKLSDVRSQARALLEALADSGDTKWAARYLNLAYSTLNKARICGTGPAFYRMGRAVRYLRRDLDEWRDRFRATSTTEADAALPHSLTTAEPKRARGGGCTPRKGRRSCPLASRPADSNSFEPTAAGSRMPFNAAKTWSENRVQNLRSPNCSTGETSIPDR
jgi:hypothetical protein